MIRVETATGWREYPNAWSFEVKDGYLYVLNRAPQDEWPVAVYVPGAWSCAEDMEMVDMVGPDGDEEPADE